MGRFWAVGLRFDRREMFRWQSARVWDGERLPVANEGRRDVDAVKE